jgi:hypothetical protein
VIGETMKPRRIVIAPEQHLEQLPQRFDSVNHADTQPP